MSFRCGLKSFHSIVFNQFRNQNILRTSHRCLKDKPWKKNISNVESKEEKDLSKVRVILKDQNGHILGDKSLVEARLLAQKWRMNLIEERDSSKHFKYKEFRLVSNKDLAGIDSHSPQEEVENSSTDSKEKSPPPTQPLKELKHIVFSTKLSENDLMTKIKHTKRWLSRGHQIGVNVTNPKNDKKILEEIYTKFENELKSFAKFNQKKIKSNNTLKFMVVPTNEGIQLLKNTAGDHLSDDMDIDNMDPNKLLSDEFEKELEGK